MRKLLWMVGALLVTAAPPSVAAVLCQKQSGALFVRTACKKKETAVNPVALGLQGPKGDPGTPGTPGSPGAPGAPGAPATALWAVVNSDGTLARGSGVVSTNHAGTGSFNVKFNRDIRQCAWIAAIGSPGSGTQYGFIEVELNVSDNSTVFVGIENTSASLADFSFHLAVFC